MSESSQHSVTQQIEGLKAGDPAAAEALWKRYIDQLVRLARKRLGSLPRRVEDEEDVALSVFDSLCRGAARGHFTQLSDRDDLWRLLIAITRQKAVDRRRHYGRKKRGGGQVRGESAFRNPEDDPRLGIDNVPGTEPTPEFLAQLNEDHQRLLDKLGDDTLRQVALWKMEGHTNDEIAELLKLSTRSVERKLGVIREAWAEELS